MSNLASNDDSADTLRGLIKDLSTPVSEQDKLASLLSAPLATLLLLPSGLELYNSSPITRITLEPSRWIPQIQYAILRYVIPAWEIPLAQANLSPLVDQYFCPIPSDLPQSGELALNAYSILLTPPIGSFAIRLLARLANMYSIDRLYMHIFRAHGFAKRSESQKVTDWEGVVRDVVAVPGKIANVLAGDLQRTPRELETE